MLAAARSECAAKLPTRLTAEYYELVTSLIEMYRPHARGVIAEERDGDIITAGDAACPDLTLHETTYTASDDHINARADASPGPGPVAESLSDGVFDGMNAQVQAFMSKHSQMMQAQVDRFHVVLRRMFDYQRKPQRLLRQTRELINRELRPTPRFVRGAARLCETIIECAAAPVELPRAPHGADSSAADVATMRGSRAWLDLLKMLGNSHHALRSVLLTVRRVGS